jgi:predicted RecA/RadA family phage recombinase
VKTFIAPGLVQEFTAPAGGVVSGSAYLIGTLLVIATETADAAAPFRGLVRGVADVAKVESETWTEGLKIYWDDTAKEFTLDSDTGSNPLVGAAVPPIVPVVVALATDVDPTDLVIVGLTLQVLDFAQLATDDAEVTVTINGVATVLVEGTDFTAATSDDVTATNLAAAIDAIDGVTATATTDTVTVVAGTGVAAATPTVGAVRLDGAAR